MPLDENAVRAAFREKITALAPVLELVPEGRIRREWPMTEVLTPRIGIHLSDRTPTRFDQGKAAQWDCYFGVVVEVKDSDEMVVDGVTLVGGDLATEIIRRIEPGLDGVGFTVPGHKTQGIQLDRVSGEQFDPATHTIGRVVSARAIVQPGG